MCMRVWVFMGVCVCGCGMLICFVSALGSHEMGRHKLPIITIIIHIPSDCFSITVCIRVTLTQHYSLLLVVVLNSWYFA